MRGAGWELLDSWILQACGLISRTKPTQWGGADVAFFPLNWNFLPAREEVAQSLYWLAAVVKEFADCVLVTSRFFCEGSVSAPSLLFWPHEKNFLPLFLCSWLFDPHIYTVSGVQYQNSLDHETLDEKTFVVQELNCLWKVFSWTKRKLTARQCLSKEWL